MWIQPVGVFSYQGKVDVLWKSNFYGRNVLEKLATVPIDEFSFVPVDTTKWTMKFGSDGLDEYDVPVPITYLLEEYWKTVHFRTDLV